MTVESTIGNDVHNSSTGDDGADDGFNAFLSSLTDEDPKKPSTETTDEATETEEVETTEATEHDDTSENEDTEADPDDAEVEVKVGDEVKKATIKELKRLYGQEAALTQRSQKVAEQQRVAEARDSRASVALNGMLEKAKASYAPYEALDMLVLSQRMDTETFEQLRKDAAAAKANVDYLTTELDGHVTAAQQRTQQQFHEAAQACVKVLTDPQTGIEGWGKPLYDELMSFADTHGMTNARALVDPSAIRLLHMALLFAKSKQDAAAVAKKVQKVVDKSTRSIRPGGSQSNQPKGAKAALDRLRASGDPDDAVAAFEASFAA